jgi:hypothetical protein
MGQSALGVRILNIAAVYERPLIGALIELISIVVIIESRNSDKNAYNSESERVNLCPLLGTIEDPLSPGVLRRVRGDPIGVMSGLNALGLLIGDT